MELKDVLGKKKKEKDGDDLKKKAKLGVLKDLKGVASEMMRDGMKATVMAKDKKGLKEGLEKAEEVVDQIPDKHDEDEPMEKMEELTGVDLDEDDEEGESAEHKMKMMAADMSPEELEAVIKMLEAKKAEMKG